MLQRARRIAARTQQLMISWEPFLDRLLAKAWPSYALIAALQLKLIWNIWRYRDLTSGDSASYFVAAWRWKETFTNNLIWSPLYTAYYGTILQFVQDIYAASILHRVIIVMAATLGVLAVLRSLLPPAIALLIAAWWTILPMNFNVLYEVHLFALLPVLVALILVGIKDTPWMRGSALAILVAATVLARQEFVVGAAVFALICLVRETIELRRAPAGAQAWRSRLAGYGVPILAAFAVCAFFYSRAYNQYSEILLSSNARHTLNMCQGYAFTWLQIHPESNLNPWYECSELMQRVFGNPRPTIAQMISANPSAAWEYLWWNASLTLNGLQLALFNTFAGAVSPDYGPVRNSGKLRALVLSLGLLSLVIWAGVLLTRQWNYWWTHWLRGRRGLWLLMFALLCITVPVAFVIRPRPSYLFPTTVVLMTVVGTAIQILTRSRATTAKFACVGIVLVLLAALPSAYSRPRSDLSLYMNYQRLLPFRPLLTEAGKQTLLLDFGDEVALYLALPLAQVRFQHSRLLSSWNRQQSLEQFIRQQGIDFVFVTPRFMNELKNEPQARELLERPETLGWRRLGPTDPQDRSWLLLQRETARPG